MGYQPINSNNNRKQRLLAPLPTNTAIAILAILILTVTSAFYTQRVLITDVNSVRIAELSDLAARKLADEVSQYIDAKQTKLDSFASRNALTSSIESDSAIALETVKSGLKSTYPEALSIRLLTLDRQELLNTVSLPLTFIELDMLNRAEGGELVAPEAMQAETNGSLTFVAPIKATDGKAIIGTVLISLPLKPLLQQLKTLNGSRGQIKLLRKATRHDLLIFQHGHGGTRSRTTVDIKNSEWRLMFTASQQLVNQASKDPALLLSLHVIIAFLLIFLAWWLTGKPRIKAEPSANEDSTGNTTKLSAKKTPADILSIEISSDDADILVLEDQQQPQLDEPLVTEQSRIALPDNVFRAYDIRGKTETEITPEFARMLGQAFASEALDAGEKALFVARDGRILSPLLCDELIGGIISTGCDVIDLGPVPTPLMYFATHEISGSHSGIMVTASHNSSEYNGFKMVIENRTLVAADVQEIKQRMLSQRTYEGHGQISEYQVVPEYIDRIFSDVALAGSVKVVIDAGNGITANVAPLLFEELGCEVVPLYCDIDGNFPNHDPDPTIVDNLMDLISAVKDTGADLGIALDGDGDRLVAVTPKGEIIWPDRLLMLFAKDIVSGNPGADVIFDVKSTRELNSLISSYGGRPIMWKTGHSNMKTKMQETGALLGGEMSGHIFFKDRWYGFDDGMYAAARMLEIMTLRDQDIDSLFDSFPSLPSTPEIKINVSEEKKFGIIEQLKQKGKFGEARINPLDGLRVEFPEGWGLVRASNTSPALTLRFEAESDEKLLEIQELFRQELLKIDGSLEIPF